MLENIPVELRELRQWCYAGPKSEPMNPRTRGRAAVDNPTTWGTFKEAVQAANGGYVGIVLSDSDPYTIIDLDNKVINPATNVELARHGKILEVFNSYTERSRSGRGWHIIVRGKIPAGRNAGKIEVYSTGRFMVTTGNVPVGAPRTIENRQDLLDHLIREMPVARGPIELDENGPEPLTDAELFDRAASATNGEKFLHLTSTPAEIQAKEWPGNQSDADLALISILCFWTKNNAQVRRIFRCSPLGQRSKATQNDVYLNRTISRVRSNEPPEVSLTIVKPIPEAPREEQPNFQLPPGFLGELTKWFLKITPRPVPEISTAAALGFAAGLLGRSYNISGVGLNQYILLLGGTGTGKEGMATAVDAMVSAIRPTIPMIDEIIGPSAFASGQAITKTVSKKPCFVSLLGEFGLTLQSLSDPRNATAVVQRKVLLDVFGKSGYGKSLKSSAYSDSEKNVHAVASPALTLLGESTPDTFFNGLAESHISEGLIPRFLILHYTGKRVPFNEDVSTPCPDAVLNHAIILASAAFSLQQQDRVIVVERDAESKKALARLNKLADSEINNSQGEVSAELWNRAHLKVLKLAALLAVCDNPHTPIINIAHVNWAENLVRKDIDMLLARFNSGDIGVGDSKQFADIRRALKSYFAATEEQLMTYAVPVSLQKVGVVPYIYLQRRLATLSSFVHDRMGSTGALRKCVEQLVATGEFDEIPKQQAASMGFSGRMFKVNIRE